MPPGSQLRGHQPGGERVQVVDPLVHDDGGGLDPVAGDRGLRLFDQGVAGRAPR